jgi:hypothetical protein
MKLGNLVDNVLLEKKNEINKNLNIFFNINVLIQGFPETETPKETPPEEDVTAQEEDVNLYEDIYKHKVSGELVVSYEEIDNIQTLEDLIDYLGDQRVAGKPIISEAVEEIILALIGVGARGLEDLIHEGDKIYVDVDYGKEKANSVGIRVNKQGGSTSISISMKKDNKILPGEFDLEQFNKQLVFYRNSIFGE